MKYVSKKDCYTHTHTHTVMLQINENFDFFYTNAAISIICIGGARGVMVILIGNEHGDTSSNPGRN